MKTTTTEKPSESTEETPPESEVEKVVERETVPKAEAMVSAVTATPRFTG
jgi:hypothetical protein